MLDKELYFSRFDISKLAKSLLKSNTLKMFIFSLSKIKTSESQSVKEKFFPNFDC